MIEDERLPTDPSLYCLPVRCSGSVHTVALSLCRTLTAHAVLLFVSMDTWFSAVSDDYKCRCEQGSVDIRAPVSLVQFLGPALCEQYHPQAVDVSRVPFGSQEHSVHEQLEGQRERMRSSRTHRLTRDQKV